MNLNSKIKYVIACTSLFLTVGSSAFSQSWGSHDGTNNDAYIVNWDNSNHWSFLRLQTSNDRAWNMLNKDGLSWSFAPNADHGSMGTTYMRLSTNGMLSLGGLDGAITGLYSLKLAPDGNGVGLESSGSFKPHYQTNFTIYQGALGSGSPKFHINNLGNVGIGTTSPMAKLDVKGDVLISSNLTANNGTFSGLASGSINVSNSLTTNSMLVLGGATVGSMIVNNGSLNVSSGSLLATNLGIGVTAPHAQVHLGNILANRKIILYEDANNNEQFAGFGVSAGVLRYQVAATGNDHIFYAGTSASTSAELVRIKGNGLVGIGTTSPSNTLDVEGSMAIGKNFSGSKTAPVNGLLVEGYVGIGTSSPSAPLQFGNDNNEQKIILKEHSTTLPGDFDGFGADVDRMIYQASQATDHVFYGAEVENATNRELMRIKSNGNVGIGTSTPSKGKLHIVGGFHVENPAGDQTFHVSAEKQLVFVGNDAYQKYLQSLDPNAASGAIQTNDFSLWVSKGIITEDVALVGVIDWSDFVFSKDYNLSALEKVEAYIQQNGHLPDMFSEEEIKKNGYTLHDINKKLLQKIEELTLYAIEQNKKIKDLENKFEMVKQLSEEVKNLKALNEEKK